MAFENKLATETFDQVVLTFLTDATFAEKYLPNSLRTSLNVSYLYH